jgi:hypothetical protein
MSVFRNIERRIAGFVEGAFGRTFRSGVQPAEIARKLAKEMDDHRTISIHRVYVPNEYMVYLNPQDHEQFAAFESRMTNELEEYLVEHARREGYSIATRPAVLFQTEPDVAPGMFGISVRSRGEPSEEAAVQGPPVEVPEPDIDAAFAEPLVPEPPVPAAPVPPPAGTMIYAPEPAHEESAATPSESARLAWQGGSAVIDAEVTVIGRAGDCDVRLEDPNVSRRHAEIRRVGRGFSLVDLDSTNGTLVNGQPVAETALMDGDVIAVGTTRLTFERHGG